MQRIINKPMRAPFWNPQPITPPAVDPEIEHLDPIQRSAESIRYSILSVEYWVSKNGQVREWLRHNSRLAAWLAIPAMLVLPLVGLVLAQFGAMAVSLVGIAGNLIIFPILALLAGLVIMMAIRIIKSLIGIK